MIKVISSIILITIIVLLDFSISFFVLKNNIKEKFISIKSITEPNERLSFTLKPNSTGPVGCHNDNNVVNISNNGFRVTKPIQSDKKTIHVFGDSFTFGYGVADHQTFPYFLSAKLENYNVINYGVPGWGILQMYQSFLENNFRINSGDIVVLAPLYEDFTRDLNSPHFLSFMYLFSSLNLEKFPKLQKSKVKYIHINTPTFYLRAHLFNSKLFGSWAKSVLQNTQKSLRDSEEIITLFSNVAKKRRAHFLMTVLPDSYREREEALKEEQ